MQSSGKFRGEALKQRKLQGSDPSWLTQVQEKIGWMSCELAHMTPVSSHHMQGSKSSGLRANYIIFYHCKLQPSTRLSP